MADAEIVPPRDRQQSRPSVYSDDRDGFGESVALSADGSTALVGTRRDEDPNGTRAGSAYVFADPNDDGTWTQQDKLAADDGDDRDRFGRTVALSGDGTTALVGAANDEDPNGDFAGSAYVFTDDGTGWSQREKRTALDGDGRDEFGSAVALSSDGVTAIVGASDDENPNGGSGSAYVFYETL